MLKISKPRRYQRSNQKLYKTLIKHITILLMNNRYIIIYYYIYITYIKVLHKTKNIQKWIRYSNFIIQNSKLVIDSQDKSDFDVAEKGHENMSERQSGVSVPDIVKCRGEYYFGRRREGRSRTVKFKIFLFRGPHYIPLFSVWKYLRYLQKVKLT